MRSKIKDILSERFIKIPLENTEKGKIIEEMVDVLYRAGVVREVMREIEREESSLLTVSVKQPESHHN